eukprot:2303959-Amphidinium_carterae.1
MMTRRDAAVQCDWKRIHAVCVPFRFAAHISPQKNLGGALNVTKGFHAMLPRDSSAPSHPLNVAQISRPLRLFPNVNGTGWLNLVRCLTLEWPWPT